ncbi:hypothetical protein SAY86_028011 [Trapa natans]|uniref:Uncharacterized protein n=1 Tax=Trapa natans TaxID=22666 RepID=A0AAN7MEV3_TRANT|nr:hypothetical protein SAY86_028011 [Trapa natans]
MLVVVIYDPIVTARHCDRRLIMSNNKEDKTQDVAERIKAAALSAAKGLSRAQAEKAAAIAARNLNVCGQKEECCVVG